MSSRYLEHSLRDIVFPSHKIALVSGPRQVGKTTLAKALLKQRGRGSYHNGDDVSFRRIWTRAPREIIPLEGGPTPIIVLDEIHKARGWKRTLKGIFDTLEAPADLIVTGSARLNVYRKGGDSLLGRAYHFRLHPFSLGELLRGAAAPPNPKGVAGLLDARPTALLGPPSASAFRHAQETLDNLLRFGGFPEPLFAASDQRARLWRRSRVEKVVHEDVRDLTRIPELGRLATLAALLPERIASPLSRASLREDLEVSFDTISRWLSVFSDLYYLFEIHPYVHRIARSLKREGKAYLWDWSEVSAPGPRFENLLASHLLKSCHHWTDTGEGAFELHVVKNKEKHEIDFLVTRDRKPWLLVEAKVSDTTPSPHFRTFLASLGCPTGIQVVHGPTPFRLHEVGAAQRVLVLSAAEFLSRLV